MPDFKIITLVFGAGVTQPHLDPYEVFMENLPELQGVYESLMDEDSKRTFCGYWLGNISHQFGELVHANTPHYVNEGFIPKKDDIVIAAGAADGGTATFFSQMGCKVYTFEMQKNLFEKTKIVAEEKGFVIENLGLSSFDGKLGYSGQTLTINQASSVNVTTVDSYIREKNLPRVDFIQLDVEGAELDVLRGAAASIARFKPVLAISVYHKWNDFWVLMNFVKSIRSDYEFAMRKFPETVEDMPDMVRNIDIQYSLGIEPDWRNFSEVVLFAR